MTRDDDKQFNSDEADDLLTASQDIIKQVNERYVHWYDKYGTETATRMLGMLIATVAVAPATGTDDPDNWVETVKVYVDGYWENWKQHQRDRHDGTQH